MKVSEFYNNRQIIESFGRAKAFDTCRRMRDVFPGFPMYQEQANEFVVAWLIYIMSKTGPTTTKEAVYNALLSGKNLKSGEELFIIWLGNTLRNLEKVKEIKSIWIWQDEDFIQVNTGREILIFQGKEKVKAVSRATQLSGAFLYDFAKVLNESLIDESENSEMIFESEGEN